jgi:hypothetical protein
LTGVELGQDGDEKFGYGEGEEKYSEFVFPGSLGPSASVSGREGTDVEIIEEEETIDDCHMIETNCGDRCFGMDSVFGKAGVLKGHEHDVHDDWNHVWEDVDNPFVG